MSQSGEKTCRAAQVLLLFTLALCGVAPTASAQVRVLEGGVAESRRSDGFSSDLKVELKVVGDLLKDARGIRVVLEKAVDETGKNLIDEKKAEKDFSSVSLQGDNTTKLSLSLKPSERRAAVIREVSGYVEIFLPTKDARSVITVTGVMKGAGRPLADPKLKAAGIEVTLWTREQFEARKKAEEERLRKEQEAKRKQGGGEPMQELGELLVEGLGKIFGGMFGGFDDLSDTSVVMTIKDPGAKLLDIEFEDAAGKKLKTGRSSSFSGQDGQTRVFDLDEKLSDTARVKFAMLTPAAVTKVPFKLTNVALP